VLKIRQIIWGAGVAASRPRMPLPADGRRERMTWEQTPNDRSSSSRSGTPFL
jgi:hypothetical protein